ncbi:hypothetical protein [Glycomyces paridis]|uniref:Uncharacterized protein n=1 Tax=Glycomyces paridis TaxID=2126555 RepID=A0A4S8PQ34_9ACTN|nr:hypothetical protein [Glycomyces paridis]THV31915.1 hypothetical protein E9998_00150 [Glycomyces paridis]
MDTTEPPADFYESDLAFGEKRIGEMWEHEAYTLRFNLPAGLSFREADSLAHRIVVEIADRYTGAAESGSLGREFDSGVSTSLSRKPGSTISGVTSLAAMRELQRRAGLA